MFKFIIFILSAYCFIKDSAIPDTVFMDIEYTPRGSDKSTTETLYINLHHQICPKTCSNFYEFISSEDSKSYKGSIFHRIIKNFMIQGGDFINKDGTGSYSKYGGKFEDENFKIKHEIGCLSMANAGPNTNGCQFFITTGETPWLNGKHVVFGNVASEKDLEVVLRLQDVETYKNDRPKYPVKIVNCGGASLKVEKEKTQKIDSGIQIEKTDL